MQSSAILNLQQVDRVAPDIQLALQAELHVHQDSVLALQAHSGIVMGPIVVILLVYRFTSICVNKAFIKSTVFFLEASPPPWQGGSRALDDSCVGDPGTRAEDQYLITSLGEIGELAVQTA